MARVWPMVSALAQMTSWSGQNIGCFSPNPFYVGWLAWFQVRLHPSPLKYFLEPVFARFATAVRQRGQKNTWKHQSLAKRHTNYFGRLVAKFQQTAISSICLGAFKRFSAMTLVSFSNLISGSEKGGEGPHSAHKCNMAPDQPFGSSTPWSADCTLSSICANKRST